VAPLPELLPGVLFLVLEQPPEPPLVLSARRC
jgi:hypothetical protein